MATRKDTCIVKFVRDHVVQDERAGTAEEERYTKGQRKSFPIRSAEHFVSRGSAVYVRGGKAD
ncbi:hypothetical protein [Roseivivax isoporae]|uniref:Uncharacterized protein n=1 Tax=Roseivivax isoporae LMG 25204 TaxID=1449351 RepID=X7F158_9RHOB|nr:hypothetical protein [Roseivivax isoporae]ETX26473.1 hypothetical protein RISW2_01780 [Roseivivax isoporae LMG 25204]